MADDLIAQKLGILLLQAKAVIFFVLVVAIGLLQLRATRSKEVQQ